MLPKFRIWDKEEKHMKTFPSSVGHLVGEILTEQMRGESNSIVKSDYSKYVVMMGTGLKDKNGKEIFEGDILGFNSKGKRIVEVFYEEGCFKVKDRKTIRPLHYHLDKYRCEIIGNIYENPELLKERK